jgi:hypothetical protein
MKIEVSDGEIVDKFTILKIKKEKVSDSKSLEFINREYFYLKNIIKKFNISDDLIESLYEINKKLWDIEDKIRIKERDNDFGINFINLARSVYITNDERAKIKKEINIKTKSNFREIKNYSVKG